MSHDKLVADVSRKQLLNSIASGKKIILLNIQSEEDYLNEHIPGSINIPSDKINEMTNDLLNIDEKVIIYGADYDDMNCDEVAMYLISQGYKDVSIYYGGIADYKKSYEPLIGRFHEYYSDTDYFDAMAVNDEYFDYLNYYKHHFKML